MKMKIRNKAAFTQAVTPLEEENRQVSYEAALEGIVLLENDGTLPLTPGKVALYGAGAQMATKGGTGSGEVKERHVVSILEGLEEAGFTVTTRDWIQRYAAGYEEAVKAYRVEFLKGLWKRDEISIVGSPFQYPFGPEITQEDIKASDTDTCIYVVTRQAGEGGDRKLEGQDYTLSEEEKRNLEICARNYARVILVINVGGVFDLSVLDEIPQIRAVVYFAQQGMMGGQALADLIRGKVSPSAKTVDTWPRRYEDIPFAMDYSYLNGNVEEEDYREGIYVGYRYFDSYGVEPRYPFGYGLSYTSFSVEEESVEVRGTQVEVKARVRNTGDTYSGKEILQLYVSCPQTKLAKEYQRLAAFAKTGELAPGADEVVSLVFDVKDLVSFREEDGVFLLEEGDYILRLGTCSRETQAIGVLELDREVITQRCAHVSPTVRQVEEICPALTMDTQETLDEDVPRFPVDGEAIQTVVHSYEEEDEAVSPEVKALLDTLSAEDLCRLVAGAGKDDRSRFFEAPGSVGFTTGELLEKGIPNICLADGPAGLRIQKVSAVTRSGKVKATEPTTTSMEFLPGIIRKWKLGDPRRQPCVYQFATSFPVELALAQSWNTALLERVGEAIGKEMEAYGVTYWLAPGVNIHRNPLCGRNFEYYSEDPLLSGKMAAAVSRGLQSRRGCFVTVKHFCCNNQEENRNRMNVNVRERALREIYLRGFEIALREGGARSVMSSYNRVNGEYVNNSYDLLVKVLRQEWGFDGLVMTDWFATGKDLGSHSKAIQVGNDLLMPGGKAAVRELERKVKTGELEEKALRRCGARVLEGILGSRIYQAYRRGQEKVRS